MAAPSEPGRRRQADLTRELQELRDRLAHARTDEQQRREEIAKLRDEIAQIAKRIRGRNA